jgi:hypothetical protein
MQKSKCLSISRRMWASFVEDHSEEELQELVEWLKIRDILLGNNCKERNFAQGLELAASCSHPDAVWMTELFEGCKEKYIDSPRKMFAKHENDPRALCFGVLVKLAAYMVDLPEKLVQAAEQGYCFAQSSLVHVFVENVYRFERSYAMWEEQLGWAQQAAMQGNVYLCLFV